jgi:aerobic carbon-monoxide dehydrogenase medium subunit
MPVALRSRRHIAPFTLLQPETEQEALAMQAEAGSSAFLAGGIELIDRMKQGHVLERVIRLDRIAELRNIGLDHGTLCIGAMVTHAALAGSSVVRDVLPDLSVLWGGIANPRIRFTGTLGGNVMAMNRDHDALPALLALDATARIVGGGEVAPDQLTELQQPLVSAFLVPGASTLRLFADRTLRPALTVWAALVLVGERVSILRVAIGMAHPIAVSVTLPLDLALVSLVREAGVIASDVTRLLPEPISDGRATSAYRRRMTEVLTRRLLIRAGGGA